ncbi:ABC transporter permease [Micromonospora sp. M12]
MHAFRQILRIEARLYLRDRPTLLTTVGLPTLILVVLGLIPSLREPDPNFEGQTFVSYFAPSLLVVTLAMVGVNTLPAVLATYRERGVLRRLATTRRTRRLCSPPNWCWPWPGSWPARCCSSSSPGWRSACRSRHPLGFTLAFILGTAALLALGLLVAAVARTTKAAQALAVPLFLVTMFFGGVYLPRFLLPDFVARIGDYTPPGVQALFDAWTGTPPQPLHLGIMAVIAVVAGACAAKLFRWE